HGTRSARPGKVEPGTAGIAAALRQRRAEELSSRHRCRLQLRVFHQQLRNGFSSDGAGVEITLGEFTSQLLEMIGLCWRLHPFGHHSKPEIVRETDNDAHYLAAFPVALHLGNKAAVYLQAVHGK